MRKPIHGNTVGTPMNPLLFNKEVDLSNYPTKEEMQSGFQEALIAVNQMLSSYCSKEEISKLTSEFLSQMLTETDVINIVDEIINEALNSEV